MMALTSIKSNCACVSPLLCSGPNWERESRLSSSRWSWWHSPGGQTRARLQKKRAGYTILIGNTHFFAPISAEAQNTDSTSNEHKPNYKGQNELRDTHTNISLSIQQKVSKTSSWLTGTHTHIHTLLPDIIDEPRSPSTADGIRGRNHETQGSFFPHSHPFPLPLSPTPQSLSLSLFLSSPSPCLSTIPAVSLSSLSFVVSELWNSTIRTWALRPREEISVSGVEKLTVMMKGGLSLQMM